MPLLVEAALEHRLQLALQPEVEVSGGGTERTSSSQILWKRARQAGVWMLESPEHPWQPSVGPCFTIAALVMYFLR